MAEKYVACSEGFGNIFHKYISEHKCILKNFYTALTDY